MRLRHALSRSSVQPTNSGGGREVGSCRAGEHSRSRVVWVPSRAQRACESGAGGRPAPACAVPRQALSRSSVGPAGGGGGGMCGCDDGERSSGVLLALTGRLGAMLIAGGAGACESERTVAGTACSNGAACAACAWTTGTSTRVAAQLKVEGTQDLRCMQDSTTRNAHEMLAPCQLTKSESVLRTSTCLC